MRWGMQFWAKAVKTLLITRLRSAAVRKSPVMVMAISRAKFRRFQELLLGVRVEQAERGLMFVT